MKHFGLRYIILAVLLSINCATYAAEAQAELRLIALSETTLSMMSGEERLINYLVENHSADSYSLHVKPSAGIMQKTGDGLCNNEIFLKPGQSCHLNLLVRTPEALALQKSGPELEAINLSDNKTIRLQPKLAERLSVTELPANTASLSITVSRARDLVGTSEFKRCFSSLAGCTLSLFKGTDSPGVLSIVNTSNITAKNIRVTSSLPTGVIQAQGCPAELPAGQTCKLIFYPGSATYVAGVPVTIKGDNTAASDVIMQVLGIGDVYNDGQLFELPSSSNSYIFTTVLSTDVSSSLQNWSTTNTLCTNRGLTLPSLDQLNTIYMFSTCSAVVPPLPPFTFANGTITGFVCNSSGNYWSSVTNNYYSFETGGSGESMGPFRGRCIHSYVVSPLS